MEDLPENHVLCDGCFLFKDCFYYYYIIIIKVILYMAKITQTTMTEPP